MHVIIHHFTLLELASRHTSFGSKASIRFIMSILFNLLLLHGYLGLPRPHPVVLPFVSDHGIAQTCLYACIALTLTNSGPLSRVIVKCLHDI